MMFRTLVKEVNMQVDRHVQCEHNGWHVTNVDTSMAKNDKKDFTTELDKNSWVGNST